MVKKILSLVDTCVIGTCNDQTKFNACKNKREEEVIINRHEIGPKKDDDDNNTYFFLMDDRYSYNRMFQEINNTHKKLELHDITIHFKFTTYHNRTRERENRVQINTSRMGTSYITPLLDVITFKFFLVEICDYETSKSLRPTWNDLSVDGEIKDVHFKDYIKPILETEVKVSCDGCAFQEHEVTLCLDLKKLKVCIIQDEDTGTKLFDKGNYAMIILIDYFDWMYKFKKEKNTDPMKLGDDFNTRDGNCGIPAFIHGGYIEETWKPDLSNIDVIDNLFSLMNKCCDKKE
jgi:hypothetical protein